MNAVLSTVLESAGTGIRVAIPGIVEEWNPDEQTVTVQPAIREKISFAGEAKELNIPLLMDVPVVFPRAGGYGVYMVPKKGDECLVVFGDMCFDSWWQSGGIQSQADSRRHDLSDGFAILGPWSLPRKLENYPEKGLWIQDDAGNAGISVVDGTVNIFGSVLINGKSYSTHAHSISSGSTQTGGVV